MEKSKKPKQTQTKLPLIVSIVGLAIVAFVLFKLNFGNTAKKMKDTIIPAAIKKVINNASTEFAVGTVKETNGVYEFELTINPKKSPQKYTSYITKDGKIVFTSGIKLDSLNSGQGETKGETKTKLTCNDVGKIEQPTLTAFVVSGCPFGLQMQRLFSKAMGEIPDLASYLQVKYIGTVENGKITSMHGENEAQENLRQICIREEQKDRYWNYVNCYMQEGKSEECLVSSGVNADLLKTCVEDPKKGIAYAQKDFNDATKFNVTGSPTLVVNDKQIVSEFDFGGRVVDGLKQISCCASKVQGEYCKKEASKTEVASSFSTTIDVTPGAQQNSASCGTQ